MLAIAFVAGGVPQFTIAGTVLMVWSLILVPIGILDLWYDNRKKD